MIDAAVVGAVVVGTVVADSVVVGAVVADSVVVVVDSIAWLYGTVYSRAAVLF